MVFVQVSCTRLPKFSLGYKYWFGWLSVSGDCSDCFMCQNCPDVVTVLLAYVLTWQLFCDICPRGFHLKGHWLTYQIELIIKYWYDWISFNLIWNRIPSLKNSQQWPKKNALTKCNISINEPRPSWTSDLAYSCPRDWRLSASWGHDWGSLETSRTNTTLSYLGA